uniref:Uncharacterized protein n=1 Tax=Arundo donax TaxID=35708 RepID=A0A0A9G2E7_ARUDO
MHQCIFVQNFKLYCFLCIEIKSLIIAFSCATVSYRRKAQFLSVPQLKSNFEVCCRQFHAFAMSCRQIPLANKLVS